MLIVGMVSCSAFAGKYSENAFKFDHNDLSEIVLEIGSQAVPGRPFTPDMAKGLCTNEYAEFQAAAGNLGNGVGMDAYTKGQSLFVFVIRCNICNTTLWICRKHAGA